MPGNKLWLVFADEDRYGSQVVHQLKQRGQEVLVVTLGKQFAPLEAEGGYAINPHSREDYDALLQALSAQRRVPDAIVYLWSLIHSDTGQMDKFLHLDWLLWFAQALGQFPMMASSQLWFVSNQAQRVSGAETLNPEQAIASGLCQVISREYPNLTCRTIDVALSPLGTWQATTSIEQIVQDLLAPPLDVAVAYRDRDRWVQTFEPIHLEAAIAGGKQLRKGGTYLITGGLEKIGLMLAQDLARIAQVKLVVLEAPTLLKTEGRRQGLDVDDRLSQVSRMTQTLQTLEPLGAEIVFLSVDCTDFDQMRQSLASEKIGPIHGVLYMPREVNEDLLGPIQAVDQAAFKQWLDLQYREMAVLEMILQNQPLDFCLICSSLASVSGRGEAVADIAAALLRSTLTHQHNQHYALPWLTVHWDNRQLDNVADPDTPGRTSAAELIISSAERIDVFQRIVSLDNVTQIVVSPEDLTARYDLALKLDSPVEARSSSQATTIPRYARPNGSYPYVAPTTALEAQIAELWQNVLGIEHVGIHDNFFELGGDSLIATQLASRLQSAFPIEVPLLDLLHPSSTVAKQADLIEAQLLKTVEELSEEDVAHLLAQES